MTFTSWYDLTLALVVQKTTYKWNAAAKYQYVRDWLARVCGERLHLRTMLIHALALASWIIIN